MSTTYFFRRHPKSFFLAFLLSLLLVPVSAELILYEFLHHPKLLLHFPYLHKTVANIYYEHELDYMQYLPQCAQYDSALLYLLKPGQCKHNSIEFDCIYSVNSMGVRDDEESLDRPEIVVIGDSYAMGWGMDNNMIFPTLLEIATDRKTLNVSVSSYGTAREFILLDRMDVSNMKFLVIQYCTNDFDENKEYVNGGYKLKIKSRDFYESIVSNHISRVKYSPFLYCSTFFRIAIEKLFNKGKSRQVKPQMAKAGIAQLMKSSPHEGAEPIFTGEDSARYFLEILGTRNYLDGVQIILMNISGPLYTTPSFIQHISKIKNEKRYPSFIRNIITVDVCEFLNREDYFILDNHLNKSGHKKVANLLLSQINLSGE